MMNEIKHPEYRECEYDWEKWRLTYEAGDDFIERYLRKFSARESDNEFRDRKCISYVPAFAAAAVDEVKDSIFQRIAEVTRSTGSSKTYSNAVKGIGAGVDLAGTTMNSFVGRTLLTELITMRRVGTFIDMPELNGVITLKDQQFFHPYIYYYKTEDIINWEETPKRDSYKTLLLRDWVHVYHDTTGLPVGCVEEYKLLKVVNDQVIVVYYNADFEEIRTPKIIDLPEIPFVMFKLPHSLLKNIANYQIALLNLASSDIAYALKSNFPFYVEQYDPRVDNLYARPPGSQNVTIVEAGERQDAITAKNYEIEVGTNTGRRVPMGLEMPTFIAPPTGPLEASMKKQDELKRDIRMLVKLNVSNLTPKMASGESKAFDERSLEAGLSAIALELEHGERRIAKYWQWYEDRRGDVPTVKYPEKYTLQTDSDKRQEAKELQESTQGHPSITYKKEAYKITSNILVGSKVAKETLDIINKEIDTADVIVSDPEELRRDVELGLIDPETASLAKGYPKGTVEKAKADHAERMARIAESQAQARGVPDAGGTANASRDEKKNLDTEPTGSEKTRAA